MIASNIFRAIGDFFTNILFIPFDAFRSIDGWWMSNIVNVIFILIGFVLTFYWLGQMIKFSKSAGKNES
ncbi:uracil phosphoribosyltransferase [Flavobacteriaceae bacterium F08102]|nr:uracil phosphoribosyltransferase [Flavobacteriaceae bacterium F08102]